MGGWEARARMNKQRAEPALTGGERSARAAGAESAERHDGARRYGGTAAPVDGMM